MCIRDRPWTKRVRGRETCRLHQRRRFLRHVPAPTGPPTQYGVQARHEPDPAGPVNRFQRVQRPTVFETWVMLIRLTPLSPPHRSRRPLSASGPPRSPANPRRPSPPLLERSVASPSVPGVAGTACEGSLDFWVAPTLRAASYSDVEAIAESTG